MANWWDAAPKADAFDIALEAEAVDPKIAAIARSIYQQESSSGKNTKTSNAGAVGGMQIIPTTFNSVADRGWDINNPEHNARAGIRYIKQMYERAGGDPALTAAGYYGGPGGLEKARRGVAVSDPRNPKAPTTLEYGKQVASRILNAAIPSAQAAPAAAQNADGEWWASAPVVGDAGEQPSDGVSSAAPAEEGRSTLADLGEGAFQGVGRVVGGLAQLGTRGLASAVNAVAPNSNYAQTVRRKADNLDRSIREWTGEFERGAGKTTAGKVGQVAGEIVATLPVGALIPGGGLAARALGSGAAGALAGVAQPVQGDDFWREKAQQAGTGAAIGGAFPVVGAGLRAAGRGIGSAVGLGSVSPEVAQLAQRAQQQGIDIRADQLVNSKPMNALSAALDYVPFSGKGAAMNAQQKQFNTAIARTIGENTDNVAQAIKSAEKRLGGEFDRVLKNTAVKADTTFQNDLARIVSDAQNELTEDQFGVVAKQVNNILNKVKAGDVIDADAAYNIKKGLDRLSKSNASTLAHYARETRNALMDALNRSLPDGGRSFAKTRQQWANLMELDRIVPRGAEGDISAARLANSRNIRSQDLGELADIAGQFLKGRVGDSGTAQRAGVYSVLGTGALFDPVSVGTGLTVGRLANAALGSNALTNRLISRSVAPLQGGGAALSSQAASNPLLQRLAPYLSPAAASTLTPSLTEP
ncbi:lytic transglycosylase domain-containing protein [Cupriavidus gilardii]|uniref:Lytic transglycosylase domain-containing protein n=1 Tax=Cupriavidus gilardii TaxID=82541 RepID=A0A849BCK6_9BURK|nr:lytic transglycosylase domain-containing protein [Cupriavidus gilardii]KAB0597795.1 lytic transglycosylase domain-containing protein [Cupriavidus gilardii]NNH12086.1 lytic transglycosylase domain-containing protein [Cupriavidus gilardii]